MADTLKVLAQSYPISSTLTDAYIVPVATQAVVSTIVVSNLGSYFAKFRVAIAIAGGADTFSQYIRYDVPVPPNDGFDITIGITLGAGDIIRVYSDTGSISFNILGVQVA